MSMARTGALVSSWEPLDTRLDFCSCSYRASHLLKAVMVVCPSLTPLLPLLSPAAAA